MKTNENRVAIYVRVSTVHQIDKDSLPMQRQDLIAYSKLMLNTDNYVIFEDAGYSGKNTDRPRFQEMMSQMRQGLFTHLLVWKIDRISRNLLDFATMYEELKDLGVIFVSKNEQFDTSTAMGEAMLKIVLVFAELERNMTSERVTATMISRASSGLWNGGRVPYGYSWDKQQQKFSLIESEAAVVRMIHDMYEETRSLVREARLLNEKGLRTRAGNMWSPVSLHIILHNIFYCGDYRYNVLKEGDRQRPKDRSEWVTVTDHHIPIVDREQKQRIIAILDANSRLSKKRNTHKSGKYVHVFSGLLFCGNCGKPMGSSPTAAKKSWQYSKYSCPTRRRSATLCDGKWTSDPVIGEFVFNYILNMLNAQKTFDHIHSPEDLQSALLIGDTFNYISAIDPNGLNDMYDILSSGVSSEIYGKGADIKVQLDQKDSELSKIQAEKLRIERALDRLTNLYLYADDALSESEFIIQKSKLNDKLDELNESIGFLNSDNWEQSVSDQVFIQRASEFIIAQKLTDRKYVSYKRLATTVDLKMLQSFVRSIIDSITMDRGLVKQIIFRNGLAHTFIFK